MSKIPFHSLDFNDLENTLKAQGLNPYGARTLFHWHYRRKSPHPCTIDLAHDTQAYLEENYDFTLPEIAHVHRSADGTVKFLIRLADGANVETVLIPFHSKYSICLSSQVGCAMKCSFCYTGTMGLKRNLSTSEIVGQFIVADRWRQENLLTRDDKRNILSIVFMGQGEPLHNFDAVKKACEIFLCPYGTTIAIQKITISTAGYLPGLKRWHDEMPGVNLALSLHACSDFKRSELIPINKRYPLSEVMAEIGRFKLQKKQFVTYEYLLIAGLNDTAEDAEQLAALLRGRRALINLIPFNPFPGSPYQRPKEEDITSFMKILEAAKIPTMIRGTKGDDILAACGQLNSINLNNLKRDEAAFK